MQWADKLVECVLLGEGRVHQCLRDHMDQLTEGCRQEELKLNIIQSRDVRLRPKLNKLCSEEIAIFCKEVQPGELHDSSDRLLLIQRSMFGTQMLPHIYSALISGRLSVVSICLCVGMGEG